MQQARPTGSSCTVPPALAGLAALIGGNVTQAPQLSRYRSLEMNLVDRPLDRLLPVGLGDVGGREAGISWTRNGLIKKAG